MIVAIDNKESLAISSFSEYFAQVVYEVRGHCIWLVRFYVCKHEHRGALSQVSK